MRLVERYLTLADYLWDQLAPIRGLAILPFAASYVVAVDYYLGLLAEMRRDLDDSIVLHQSALTSSRPLGCPVDDFYASWQLVRLLGLRSGPGDVDRARRVADAALGAIGGTELIRLRRLIGEARESLPAD